METNSSIIYGKHSVIMACENRKPENIVKILISNKENINLIPQSLQKKVEVVKQKVLDLIAANNNGFVCYVSQAVCVSENELYEMRNIIALDGVSDVGNVGAIIRTAAAFGVEGLIYTKDKMPDIAQNHVIAKSSCGGIEFVKIFCATNLQRTLMNLQKNSFWVIGTDSSGESLQAIGNQYRNLKKVIVFGSEKSGIRVGVRKICDVFTSISIDNKIESLNVSTAAAIVMWEMCNNCNQDEII